MNNIGLVIFFVIVFHNKVFGIASNLFNKVFGTGLDSNGPIDLAKISNRRFDLWKMALNYTKADWYKIIFGPGFACDIEMQESGVIGNWVYGPQVFHSTIFETMAIGGILIWSLDYKKTSHYLA